MSLGEGLDTSGLFRDRLSLGLCRVRGKLSPVRDSRAFLCVGDNMTKTDCQFYNWNDNPDYPSYPREYGARCERYKLFFMQSNGRIIPDCEGCKEYGSGGGGLR